MRQVFSRARVFSVLIKIISDIRANFQTDIVFVYPDDLICFYLFVYVAERGGLEDNPAGTTANFHFRVHNLRW
ncbi:hypothetical protein NKB77_004996 [Salmonella enterica]|nr:hypothetical protein [Salmonella enterica]